MLCYVLHSGFDDNSISSSSVVYVPFRKTKGQLQLESQHISKLLVASAKQKTKQLNNVNKQVC